MSEHERDRHLPEEHVMERDGAGQPGQRADGRGGHGHQHERRPHPPVPAVLAGQEEGRGGRQAAGEDDPEQPGQHADKRVLAEHGRAACPRATSRLAMDTAARAPPCAPRLVMACLDSSRERAPGCGTGGNPGHGPDVGTASRRWAPAAAALAVGGRLGGGGVASSLKAAGRSLANRRSRWPDASAMRHGRARRRCRTAATAGGSAGPPRRRN